MASTLHLDVQGHTGRSSQVCGTCVMNRPERKDLGMDDGASSVPSSRIFRFGFGRRQRSAAQVHTIHMQYSIVVYIIVYQKYEHLFEQQKTKKSSTM